MNCRCPSPNCAVDHETVAEREALELADVKRTLRGLRAFREDAECDARDDDMARLHAAIDADDILESHRIRVAIWNAHAGSLIASQAQGGLYHAIAAAHIVKRRFQRDEAHMYPYRSAADNTPPLPGAAAERPSPQPRTGVDTEATGTSVAGNYPTDRRNAA